MKTLIVGSFPAPYRVAVFKEFAKRFQADIYFAYGADENRNQEWFVKESDFKYYILNDQEAKDRFQDSIRNIRQYGFVLAYDALTKPALKAVAACKKARIPYYVNCDGAIVNKNIIRDAIKRYVFKGARACFSSGKSATDYFLLYGAKKENIFEHKFSSLNKEDILEEPINFEEKNQVKLKLELGRNPMVLSIGQFIHRKGFDILLRAWKQINTKAELVIIGGGDLKESYLEYIDSNHLTGITIIDYLPKERLFEYYKAADIFVLPTREDIWGLVVNEAMAVGLPVVTTDRCVAGNELIEDGINGYIVKVCDDRELAEKLSCLIDQPDLRRQMAAANIDKIKPWTMENMAKSQVRVVETTLI